MLGRGGQDVFDDLEQASANLLLSIPDEPTPPPCPPPARGACPECGAPVARIPESGGMWSGANSNGGIAGGGWWRAKCAWCGVWLRAYWDVYSEDGEVINHPEGYEPDLVWQRDRELSPIP